MGYLFFFFCICSMLQQPYSAYLQTIILQLVTLPQQHLLPQTLVVGKTTQGDAVTYVAPVTLFVTLVNNLNLGMLKENHLICYSSSLHQCRQVVTFDELGASFALASIRTANVCSPFLSFFPSILMSSRYKKNTTQAIFKLQA